MKKGKKKHSKIIPIIIFLLIIVGGIFVFLSFKSSVAYKESINYYTGEIYSLNYGANLIDKMDGNSIISPLNINSSLISLYNGSDNNTKKELKKYYNLSLDDANELVIGKINNNIISKNVKDDYSLNYEKLMKNFMDNEYHLLDVDKLNKLEESDKDKILLLLKKIKYNYEGMFNEKRMSIKSINKYVLSKKDINYNNYYIKENIDDVLDKWESYNLETEIVNSNVLFINKKIINNSYEKVVNNLGIEIKDGDDYLKSINSISFSSEWEDNMDINRIKNMEFTNKDGSITAVEMMIGEEQIYYENNYAMAFKKNYKNSKYSFVGILPKKSEYKASNIDFDKLLLNERKGPVLIGIPRFSINVNNDISKIIPIDFEHANLTKISDNSISIESITQNINFNIGDKGTINSSVGKQKEYIKQLDEPKQEIILNKMFYYAIINNDTNDCIYIGKVELL